jgi:hypothetical protein
MNQQAQNANPPDPTLVASLLDTVNFYKREYDQRIELEIDVLRRLASIL